MKKNLFIFLLLVSNAAIAQPLQPGFDKSEYINLMHVSARFGNAAYWQSMPMPDSYRFIYRSPITGLMNCWELYTRPQGVAIISIRGTTVQPESWLENFYAAMTPATGSLQLSATETFTYKLANNPKAAVHVGWLVGLASMSGDILAKIDSCYKAGLRQFVIMGHSQGGGIAFLLTSWLYHLQKQDKLPADIQFKTYCSAGPKPGNLYYAYDYEMLTQYGWAYNVVNPADWVPEVPFSIQTINDFNPTNPFINAKSMIRKQKFPKNWALRHVYNKLDKPARKAQRNYQKYLGKFTSKMVRRQLPGFVPPPYYASNNYVRTGNTIVLPINEAYYQQYPDSDTNAFVHHLHPPYLLLASQLPGEQMLNPLLTGTWQLQNLYDAPAQTDSLFPNRKPWLRLNAADGSLNGNNGCNIVSGKITGDNAMLRVAGPLITTKMACPGVGERQFMEALQKVNAYRLNGKQLVLLSNTTQLMIFTKQE